MFLFIVQLHVSCKNSVIMDLLYYHISMHYSKIIIIGATQHTTRLIKDSWDIIICFSNQMSDDYMLSKATRRIEIER